jgi:hypothetical protein
MKTKTKSLAALAVFAFAGPASAATLLFADNFNGVDPDPESSNPIDGTYNVNYDLAGRQTGTQAQKTWSAVNNTQVGNTSVFGNTGHGGYMMLANETGEASLGGLTLSSSMIAASEKLVISFKTDVVEQTVGSNWLSFTMTDNANSWPIVGSGDFGFLLQANGGMQLFNNGTVVGPTLVTSAGTVDLSFTFSGADGTGSAFAGNGSSVSISDGTNVWSTVLVGNLSAEKIAFRNYADGGRGMIDNLSITAVPEPGAALLGGFGVLALLRRRRR